MGPEMAGLPRALQPPDFATQRILQLLQDVGQPDAEGKATTLEYRGQWQPKPNGAETGHGVVPKDWAIELASENDRRLASFGWAGGAQLCLSNAFRQANEMEAQAQDLIDSGVCTEDDAAVQCIRAIAKATEEREAVMRRQWCDVDFQQGEEANRELLQHLEKDFAAQLMGVARRQREEQKEQCTEQADGSGVGDPTSSAKWFNVKVVGGTKPGKVYLSAQVGSGGVELHGYDDESGRQRWVVEESPPGFCRLRVLGGISPGRRLLGRGAKGKLELSERDDASGCQRWVLEPGPEGGWVHVRPAAGEPGSGPAAAVERESRGKFLGARLDGTLGLDDTDDGSGRQRWLLPGRSSSGGSMGSRQPPAKAKDEVVSIAIHSGAEGASSLKDMSQESLSRALNHNRNLGCAIDLVGAYLKNYEIDKADRVCSRIEPLCRERGGVWLFKLLNFYTTVRMKQSRYKEALEMYNEYETLIGFSPEEAWELYDTVYRNFGWIHTSLQNFEKALEYFEKAVEVKRAAGVSAHWFDQWDLGKSHARLSLQRGKPENLELALKLILEGLEMHKWAEPQDTIMRCKMLNSAGECACVRGDFCTEVRVAEAWYDQAIELHRESYHLYIEVLGPLKPLTGWAMEDLAGAYRKRGLHEKAKPLLHAALKVECTKDIIKLPSMARLLESVLDVHRATADRPGLAECQESINMGLENLQRRQVHRAEAESYAALLQKIAGVLLAHDMANQAGAAALLEEGLLHLRAGSTVPADAECQQAEEESERERQFSVPKAGQQQMELDVGALNAAMEEQLQLLRQGRYQQEPWGHSVTGKVEEECPAESIDFEVVDDSPPEATDDYTKVD